MELAMLYGLMLAGLLLHVLKSVRTPVIDGTFLFSFWIQRNWIDLVIGLVSGIIFVALRDDLVSAVGFTPTDGDASYRVYSLTAGFLGREWIYQLMQVRSQVIKKKQQE